MAVRLKDLLNLDILSRFRLVAGEEGLNAQVRKVGILDYETGDVIDTNFVKGEFVLTNLLIIKDDLDKLDDAVSRFIQNGVAGLAINTLFIDELPDAITNLANEHNFSIFLYDETYYEDIITELVDYIRRTDELSIHLELMMRLQNENLQDAEVQKLTYKLNPDFRNFVIVLKASYIKGNDMEQFSAYQANQILGRFHRCYIIEENIYVLMSFEDEFDDVSLPISLVESLGINMTGVFAGISNVRPIISLNKAMIESGHALTFKKMTGISGVTPVDQIGMYQMLMPLQGNPWIEEYYLKIITPIKEYDAKNGSDLLKTAKLYIDCGCDVKKTAEMMYQHGNTIRYRLDRIRGLLDGIVDKTYVDQELSIIMRIHSLKTGQ